MVEDWGWTTVKLSSANSYSYEKRDVSLNHYCGHMIKPQRKETLANGEYSISFFRLKTDKNALIRTQRCILIAY